MQMSLENIRGMSAEELFKKFKIIQYDKKDVDEINKAIQKIQDILTKYGERL